jgi:hypothetical protein
MPTRKKKRGAARTKETLCVVNPLEKFLRNRERSSASWKTKRKPKYETSATGWDLQMERHNEVLLIEAKYLARSFASAMAGLILAPLTNKTEKMKSGRKKGSWCANVAWAIGWNPKKWREAQVYQNLLDYLSRESDFWSAYHSTLRVKYIFFVDPQKKVARINFEQVMKHADEYLHAVEWPRTVRELAAEELYSRLSKK